MFNIITHPYSPCKFKQITPRPKIVLILNSDFLSCLSVQGKCELRWKRNSKITTTPFSPFNPQRRPATGPCILPWEFSLRIWLLYACQWPPASCGLVRAWTGTGLVLSVKDMNLLVKNHSTIKKTISNHYFWFIFPKS